MKTNCAGLCVKLLRVCLVSYYKAVVFLILSLFRLVSASAFYSLSGTSQTSFTLRLCPFSFSEQSNFPLHLEDKQFSSLHTGSTDPRRRSYGEPFSPETPSAIGRFPPLAACSSTLTRGLQPPSDTIRKEHLSSCFNQRKSSSSFSVSLLSPFNRLLFLSPPSRSIRTISPFSLFHPRCPSTQLYSLWYLSTSTLHPRLREKQLHSSRRSISPVVSPSSSDLFSPPHEPLLQEDDHKDDSQEGIQDTSRYFNIEDARNTSLSPKPYGSSLSHTFKPTASTEFFFRQTSLSTPQESESATTTSPSRSSPSSSSSLFFKEDQPSLFLGLPREEDEEQLKVVASAEEVKKKINVKVDERVKAKVDVRVRRRLKEIMKIMKKGENAQERLKQDLAREDEIANVPELASRRAEELRRLRLEDPLTRPIERRRYTYGSLDALTELHVMWPNFAREALPRILAAMPHVDLIVEVRDARLPLLTQLPLQPPAGGQKPRLIVLTHADQASEAGNAQWARYFRFLYRLHAAEALERDEDRGGERLMNLGKVLREPSIQEESPLEGASKTDEETEECGERFKNMSERLTPDQEGEGESDSSENTNSSLILQPPIPPVVPVLFVNAQQGGACIVRVEKAARKIVKKWKEYRRDVELYRHRVNEALKARKAALEPTESRSRVGSDKDEEELDVGSRVEPHSASENRLIDQSSLLGGKAFERRGMKTQKGRRQRYKERTPKEERQLFGKSEEEQRASDTAARGSLRTKRPLRLLVVGMPNVGKSALCNRLLGTKKARSYNYPGVTKVLTWYRRRGTFFQTNLHRLFDCVDTPGLLPPPSTSLLRPGGRGTVISSTTPSPTGDSSAASPLVSFPLSKPKKKKQEKAPSIRAQHSVSTTHFFLRDHPVWADDDSIRLLASLNKIPQSCLFTIEEAAVAFLNQVFKVWVRRPSFIPLTRFAERYKVDPLAKGVTLNELNACEYLHRLAAKNHHYGTGAATQRLLTDVAKGYLGRMTLEVPPSRQEILRAVRAARSGIREPTEDELKREQAREAIRKDRMHGGTDRKVKSDWQLLVPDPEEEKARRTILWNVRKTKDSNPMDEGQANEMEKEVAKEEHEKGDASDAGKKKKGKAARLEFAAARESDSKSEGETSQKTTTEQLVETAGKNTPVIREDSTSYLAQKATPVLFAKTKQKSARTRPAPSTVRTVITESLDNKVGRHTSRGKLLDERLKTEVEERSWEAGDFEGW
ncbi:gtp-binding conserved hypothetical domain-containing [Cystoisospora suis]|uniref:Gtp-binding conserved hypothetical domain-containing n=1 Tax=Cystoisospora suis TaxID=483139 RepID=A0A2C6KB43_9APIC|nr:gtp-binding conserved hypothetical domain-containing [Cystoisospora suis]